MHFDRVHDPESHERPEPPTRHAPAARGLFAAVFGLATPVAFAAVAWAGPRGTLPLYWQASLAFAVALAVAGIAQTADEATATRWLDRVPALVPLAVAAAVAGMLAC